MNIVVVGSINADVTVTVARHPRPGETLLGSGNPVTAGGKGANQAVAAALLGADVALVGAVGRDANAVPATARLRESGVDMSAVAQTDEVTGMAMITVADDGENTIIVIPGANATVDAGYVESHAGLISGADIVLLQGEIPADGFAAAISLATGRVVVNLAPVIDVAPDALLRADPIMANEHEADLILRMLGAEPASEDPYDLAAALLEAGFSSAVLTLGAEGALVADTSGIEPVPTPRVTAVDTTGAGDAFAGALVHRLAEGDTLVDAALFAARVGAFAVTRHGAQASYPGPGDVLPAVE
ncbi:ribokinase [Corynebacterium doosanense]|uniref:Ribokinase n=1 Tax=Corynebacterium doosanense CAU 212 = DSM 45436 TaxID=558173 RepID=A0A097IHK9_9CORY|nr:ribokinase [Corynebacterium doosanense]AIT61609.1 ribokinase [Corynebacterium doosanense CAU 212 = DSM 45436]